MKDWWPKAPAMDPFQAIRLLQRDAGDGPVIGSASDAASEPLRFASMVSFGFPASDLDHIEAGPDGKPKVWIHWLGLASPRTPGALPTWYARHLLEAEQDGNRAMRDFLDLFNHRLASLYFRAWLKHNLPVRHELEPRGIVRGLLLSLLGLGTPGLTERLRLDPRVPLRHPAAFLRRPATAAGLQLVLEAHFAVPVVVEPFTAKVVPLDSSEQTRLDGRRRLGVDSVLGRGVRTASGNFRLRLGPLDYTDFRAFLPGGAKLRDLQELVRLLAGPEYDYDLVLGLREQAVPRLQLIDDAERAARLGWSTWLGVRLGGGEAHDTLVPAANLEGQP
ncbi:MAG: type VI secretion system baseplate subunit TssG [Planctomycetes bacterium]|nr:type VI secretion system baseplate subunit TssG [Planctomycetota bacterium]MCC7398643.1 type VI secretion system baseplate subunit TssG [Planctomycetota bacterium]